MFYEFRKPTVTIIPACPPSGWQHRAVESSLVHVLPLTFSNGNTMKRTVIVSSMELAIFGTFLHSQVFSQL
ncbi:hypothetical protein F0562_011084 [Nyssa sinensis]|uniref:Uncharacterized protein n=1 Tax=Nyssa sinensis TaxID=561372 RepID=A0A5J5A5G6_9ASTE|nr:hypothetical protein F0562_011084 [Nyssa sinensis]